MYKHTANAQEYTIEAARTRNVFYSVFLDIFGFLNTKINIKNPKFPRIFCRSL